MQLGLTIPLQKFLKVPKPSYGEPRDLFFCWELHKVPDVRRSTFIAVNASNRFAMVFSGMTAAKWKRLDEVVLKYLPLAMGLEGYTEEQVAAYLKMAGPPEFTKTHGRRAVASLNRAVEMLWWCQDMIVDYEFYQQALTDCLNTELSNAAGFDGEGYKGACHDQYSEPHERFREDMARVGIPLVEE